MKVRVCLVLLIMFSLTALAERTRLASKAKSSPDVDVKEGREAAAEIEKKIKLINNADAGSYLSNLGQKLASKAANPANFKFTFKLVDDKEINAFALPGGPMYVNRGAIEAADNEAQIAGVMGHEMGHVLLRHGIAQAEKSQKFGIVSGIIGAVAGKSTAGQIIGGVGNAALGVKFLSYSREAESEADLIGTQLLYDNGYDPHAMADFFDKLAKEHKGSKLEQFFSDHPIPENRVAKVNDEIKRIGPTLTNPKADSADFQRVKKLLLGMPEPKKATPTRGAGAAPANQTAPAIPAAPSAQMTDYRVGGIQLTHPNNWKPIVNGDSLTLAPDGGITQKGDLGYGMIINSTAVQNVRSLDQVTDQFIAGLQRDNPSMKVTRSRQPTRVDGLPAQLTELTSDSPFGGQETDVVITLLRTNTQLQYFVLVVPAKDMPQYNRTFQNILNSVKFR